MKNLFIVCLLMISTVNSYLLGQNSTPTSQSLSSTEDVRSNELKLNILLFILGLGEIEYERLLNKDSGLGIHVSFPIYYTIIGHVLGKEY